MPLLKTGRRRRPTQVYWTNPPPPPAAGSPTNPPRQVVVRLVPQPYRPRRVTSTHTVLPTPGFGPAPGARPIYVSIYRPRASLSARIPRPIILRPQLGGVPNVPPPTQNRVLPRVLTIRDPRMLARGRAIVVRSGPANPIGLNPKPLVSRPVAPRRWMPATVLRPRLGRHSIQYPNPPAIVRVPRQPARPVVIVRARANPANHPWLPLRPAVARHPVKPILPRRLYQVTISSGGQLPRMRIPRPLVVPLPRPPVRPPRWLQIDSGSAYQTSQRRPIIIRPLGAIRLPYRLIGPAPHYPLASPALHGPMPRPMILLMPRSLGYGRDQSPAQRYRKYVTNPPQPIPAINPNTGTPPDLVAACIAWLRLQPAIVAAMGEVLGAEKFFSDVAARSVAPPYLAFFEPDEVEGYETVDYTGLNSTLTDGTLAFELVGSQALGKLGTRQLAEAIVAVLNDAPLTFIDGTLVYLRRSERRYPTFRESGPGTNVVIWKRVCEFDYKIERWAPQF